MTEDRQKPWRQLADEATRLMAEDRFSIARLHRMARDAERMMGLPINSTFPTVLPTAELNPLQIKCRFLKLYCGSGTCPRCGIPVEGSEDKLCLKCDAAMK